MHLSPEFGLTYREIEADGFNIDRRVEMLLSSDTGIGVAKSLGLGVIGFADAFAALVPDVVVVLGDRFEILACAQAAALLGIPVAHISGGEVTQGAIDDWIRHCVSKMSELHFVAAEVYRRRVIQLGEAPERVFNVGDPGLDNIKRLQLLSREQLLRELGVAEGAPLLLVTYHPATLGTLPPDEAMQELVDALESLPDATVVMTYPNADMGGRAMAQIGESYAARHPGRVFLFPSLGRLRYLSAMRACDALIGNSSSGIVEAPAMRKPAINIGPRQDGRLKATSIIDCGERRDDIVRAIREALSPVFAQVASATQSLYGDCDASTRIKEALKRWTRPVTLAKRFYDLPG
jgi:UDP-N-acetylglucosamine 2-epimerase (non-hydrolysing)/GDP/UDP-N,N'-diacetylbacillosamine 2-epimerase (hydrolysing)